MKREGEKAEASILELQQEIEHLRAKVAANDRALTRATAVNEANEPLLGSVLDQIHALDIPPVPKRAMTGLCLHLIEIVAMEKRLGIPLTEADALFLSKFEREHPNLNTREKKICLLVKLNYDTREIGRSVGISTRGMESIRYRLHRKLGLGKHQSIKTYLTSRAVA